MRFAGCGRGSGRGAEASKVLRLEGGFCGLGRAWRLAKGLLPGGGDEFEQEVGVGEGFCFPCKGVGPIGRFVIQHGS